MCQKWANVLTVFAVLHNFSVKLLKMFWISWKSCAIACHGVPRSNREQFTFLIVSDQVFENCSIIDKCTEFTANKLERWYHDFNQILHKLRRHDLYFTRYVVISVGIIIIMLLLLNHYFCIDIVLNNLDFIRSILIW